MKAGILWAVIVGFLAGVFVASFVRIDLQTIGFVLVIACAVFAVQWLEGVRIRAPVFFLIASIAFVLGSLRVGIAVPITDSSLESLLDTTVQLEGVVTSEPDVREASVRISINVDRLAGEVPENTKLRILAVAPLHTEVAYGDRVRVEGTLKLPQRFDTSSSVDDPAYTRQFDYPMYLAKDGITHILAQASVESQGENSGNVLQAAAIGVKQQFLAGLQAVLPEPEAGLAGGIMVGDKRSIGAELTEVFKTVSLIHIVVLSGYNITIVINALRRGLVFFPRIVQYLGIAFSVLLVVLMTGAAPSAVRAGAMSLIAVYARATARVFIALRILGVVALGMVVWNPLYLAFDPGFQLSILATLGLIVFTEPIAARCGWMTERFGLREIFASTIATQITVLPFLLYQGGLLSLVSIPANLFALIVVPYAMAASGIAALGGMTLGSFALPLAAPAYALLWYIIAIAQFFASLPFSDVSIPAFSAWWLAAAYAALGIVGWRVGQTKTAPRSGAV